MNTTYNSVCVCAAGTQVYVCIAVHAHVVTFIVCIAIALLYLPMLVHLCVFNCILTVIHIPHSNILIQ